MKKQILLACAVVCAAGASAQMNVWENGNLSAQYNVENVDSITFGITSETPVLGTGKDGITPLLKIENDYWFVSYDNGETWQQEGLARGEKGDSMFQSVTYDEETVYLTLKDGTVLKLPNQQSTSTTHNNYEYVDLGLSVMWATMNVGATSVADEGKLYAWAETAPKDEYTLANYKYYAGITYTKYIGEGKTVLDSEDDAASVNMGGSWRTPTVEEWKELYNGCTWTYGHYNMVAGYIGKSKITGNRIFLPAIIGNETSWENSARYMTTNIHPDVVRYSAYCLYANFYRAVRSYGTGYHLEGMFLAGDNAYKNRYEGFSVRAVFSTNN